MRRVAIDGQVHVMNSLNLNIRPNQFEKIRRFICMRNVIDYLAYRKEILASVSEEFNVPETTIVIKSIYIISSFQKISGSPHKPTKELSETPVNASIVAA